MYLRVIAATIAVDVAFYGVRAAFFAFLVLLPILFARLQTSDREPTPLQCSGDAPKETDAAAQT